MLRTASTAARRGRKVQVLQIRKHLHKEGLREKPNLKTEVAILYAMGLEILKRTVVERRGSLPWGGAETAFPVLN